MELREPTSFLTKTSGTRIRMGAFALGACCTLSIAGCSHAITPNLKENRAMVARTKGHRHQIYFQGLVFHYVPLQHVMAFIMGSSVQNLNQVTTVFNKRTKFYIDNKPALPSAVRQYMPAQVLGRRVRIAGGRHKLILEVVRFSSKISGHAPH